jgi:hypothetical protein
MIRSSMFSARRATNGLLLLLLLALISSASDGRSELWFYKYADLLSGYLTLVELKQRAVFFEDAGEPASFCSDDSEYYCVDSPAFHFAVPKQSPFDVGKWTVKGHLYTAQTGENRIKAFGRVEPIIVIESSIPYTSGAQPVRYYYTQEFGLLGYEIGDRERFVLAGEIGFGARGTRYDADAFDGKSGHRSSDP